MVPVAKIRKVLDVGKSESRLMKDLEIHYSVLDFRNAQQIAYRYRMKPYNNQWQEADDRRIAYYTNLPPGNFAFEVQAKHTFGNWGPVATTKISVAPDYYETLWFKLLIGVLILAFLYGVFRIRTFSLRTRSVHLAQEIRARTTQLETMNTELERVNKELHLASITDPLTGLQNRAAFRKSLQEQIDNKQPVALLFLDLDNFKEINDTLGHEIGDKLLLESAHRLSQVVRNEDTVGRLGGDEFIIMPLKMSLDTAKALAEKIRTIIEQHTFVNNIKLTLSIGVAEYLENDTLDSWITRADEALYKAKENGKNSVF